MHFTRFLSHFALVNVSPSAAFLPTRTLSTATTLRMSGTRGAFILFEGIDRCGKTTQCNLLSKSLAQSELIRFPNRVSTIGQLIDSYLKTTTTAINDNTIHLLFSANRWEAATDINSKLAGGTTLICDRYAYSGVAFSSAKEMDMNWCKSCDRGLPAPDVIIYLDIPVEESSQRGNFGEERYEKIDFQKKVREKFMLLKAEDEQSQVLPWHVLDARKTIEELQVEIANIAAETVKRVQHTPITPLWNTNN